MIRIKHGVQMTSLAPQLLVALTNANELFNQHGAELVVTSGTDGHHSWSSLHYAGAAIDIRTNTLPAEAVESIVDQLKDALGTDYDVVNEGDHVHIEWQPKRPM